jgi:predicted pyridoxine 5'-phosphate oxidase superfamily flavin-nucleotide-binding protein
MSETTTPAGAPAAEADAGFHAGELAVQQRAGVQAEAARLAGMLQPVKLGGGIGAFLADRTFAVITARDAAGRLWTSPLSGPPGFLKAADAATLAISFRFPDGDPLHGLRAGQKAGLVIVEFAARRRVRINGTLAAAGDDRLEIKVEQGYGNCPQYINQRLLAPAAPGVGAAGAGAAVQPGQQGHGDVRRAVALSPADVALIRAADTFFLGTANPERGSDASHRAGRPGFVRVDSDQVWWPDYPGNKLFNSFGNLAVNPEAALLFPDFGTGRALYLSGTAEVDWNAGGKPGDDGHTGRRAVFTLRRLVAGSLLSSRQVGGSRPYPLTPPITG